MLEVVGRDDYLASFAIDNLYSEFAYFFSRMSLVAGSKSEGNSYVPIIIDRANDSSDKYLNRLPRRDFVIGAL
jgi:hypothetical protein